MSISASQEERVDLTVLIPVFDDWVSAERLVRDIDKVLSEGDTCASILFVDDGSRLRQTPNFSKPFTAIRELRILRMKRNLGHQRAICIGLCHVHSLNLKSPVLVMDGDGEDRPADIMLLLSACESEGQSKIVFAERTRRSEGWLYFSLYRLYCMLHYVLVGVRVRVGNFSLIPAHILKALVVIPELWNHYAASVFMSGQPYTAVPTVRGHRISGKSKMKFVSLVVHGLSAISVFSSVVGVRVLCVLVLLVAGVGSFLALLLAEIMYSGGFVSGITVLMVGIVALLLLQLLFLALLFCFLVLGGRAQSTFLPVRDFNFFVDCIEDLQIA